MITRDDVTLAHELAQQASSLALSYSDEEIRAWVKPDGSTVTEADLAVDGMIQQVLRARRPRDAVLSEESAAIGGSTNRQWIIDPIDGTSQFVSREAAWGTHVALSVGGTIWLGVITRPRLGICWWAVRGQGAFTGGIGDPASAERIAVSNVDDLRRARVGGLVEPGSASAAVLAAHAQWSSDPVSVIGALAEGRLDAVLDDAGAAWDQAPATLLITEAGGRFRDPLGGTRHDLGWGLYSNAALYFKLLDLIPNAGG